MTRQLTILFIYCMFLFSSNIFSQQVNDSESVILDMLESDRPYHVVSEDVFVGLGWSLPDNGETVKTLANSSTAGNLDPRKLEPLQGNTLGYSARWHEHRYDMYGLEWDITGLYLMPENPVPDMPTLVLIHGGSSNWYEFFLDPLNNPGLGQYLAQRIPVLIITIPGNYRHGGWNEEKLDSRVPAYLLDKNFTNDEIEIRNTVYTFQLVSEGARQLIEETTSGPIVIIGHSTAGEIPYILHGSSLARRMNGHILGWGSGGTSAQKAMQDRWGYSQTVDSYPVINKLRPRPIDNYSQDYLGPLNPVWEDGLSRIDIARKWMGVQEFQRRPHFKQPLQDMERRGAIPGMQEGTIEQIENLLKENRYGVDVESVVTDLFSPMRAPLTSYSKMILTTARLDAGHWNKDEPEKASTLVVANEFRQLNPDIPVRVLFYDVPMTHYGHIERPKQLAAGLYTALIWLTR